jgi:hypothetical protein
MSLPDPSHSWDAHVACMPDPTELETKILCLLEEAGIHEEICDQIIRLVDIGQARKEAK